MLKSQYIYIFTFLFFSLGVFGQNFVVDGDFKKLSFRSSLSEVENGFAQLKLLDNYSWLKYSSSELKIYFENGESQFASINVSDKQFAQTQLCCYPQKDLEYDISLTSKLSPYSKYGLAYIQVYFLSEPYLDGTDLSTQQVIILTIDKSKEDWQELKGRFLSSGKERYILIGVIGEYKNDIFLQESALAYDEDVIFDLLKVSLHLAKGQQDDQKASDKVEF